jgi:hypothetical protein
MKNPVKISVFAVPSHVVFRPSGRAIRACNEGKSLPLLQHEALERRRHQASKVRPVQSAMLAGKSDCDK